MIEASGRTYFQYFLIDASAKARSIPERDARLGGDEARRGPLECVGHVVALDDDRALLQVLGPAAGHVADLDLDRGVGPLRIARDHQAAVMRRSAVDRMMERM